MPSTTTPVARRLAAFAILSLGAAVAACSREGDALAETAPNPVTVGPENVVVAAAGELETGPLVSGALSAEKEATLRAEVAGPVLATLAEAGERVTRGQLLARIDDTAIRDQFLSARSGLTTAQTNADVAARELDRMEALLKAGAIAEREAEQARRANVAAQSALADARARLSLAQEQLDDTQIRAPFDGTVSERQVSAGDIVQPGSALFTVIDPSTMRLEAAVPAEQLASVRIGVPVSFTVNGYPGREFTGRVTRVNPVADPVTRQVRIFASIPNAGRTLVGGLFAEGRVASESRAGIIVPQNAVNERGATPTVMRVKQGRAEQVSVRLGLRDAAREVIEIAAGIAAGDTLLLGAAQGISVGTPVKVGSLGDVVPETAAAGTVAPSAP
jgi:membrane fusion protein (multidrug efflux system)